MYTTLFGLQGIKSLIVAVLVPAFDTILLSNLVIASCSRNVQKTKASSQGTKHVNLFRHKQIHIT